MNFAPTPEQAELKRAARRFLATRCASANVRAAMESETGLDEETWSRAARDLGWASIAVPEAYGGAGLAGRGWVELAAVAEETGRAVAPLPLLSTCLATSALLAAGDCAASSAHLPAIARGETLATLAFAEDAHARPLAIETTARSSGGDWVLAGEKRYVVDGHVADLLIVAARAPGTAGEDGVALFAVDGRAPGVTRTRVQTMDKTRPLALVTLRDVRVPDTGRMGDARVLRRALDRAAVFLAAEQLGGAERCLEMATEYAKARIQFDRPIGSFQAIKHKLADMFMAVETARSAATWAASVASTGDDAELAIAAPLAKSYCGEAFFRCAAECVQIHGGIGFTWEHDAHLFLKRARGSLALLGSPAADRERIAASLNLGDFTGSREAGKFEI
jgi:alkylation response protein AidB-like acyl-CoA dehydrogenase